MNERKFGYFSEKASEIYGKIYYSDTSGRQVAVTHVSESQDIDAVKKSYKWPDVVSVGEVRKYLFAKSDLKPFEFREQKIRLTNNRRKI